MPEDTGDLNCPPVTVRAGASTYAVAAPGKQPVGNDLRFQATITKMARECSINGGVITARIGIQGRVIAGPAGAPSSIQCGPRGARHHRGRRYLPGLAFPSRIEARSV